LDCLGGSEVGGDEVGDNLRSIVVTVFSDFVCCLERGDLGEDGGDEVGDPPHSIVVTAFSDFVCLERGDLGEVAGDEVGDNLHSIVVTVFSDFVCLERGERGEDGGDEFSAVGIDTVILSVVVLDFLRVPLENNSKKASLGIAGT